MPRTVLSVAQTRRWEEASWQAGRDARQVVAEVGRLIAGRVMEMTRPRARVMVLCGKGNNGEDAAQVGSRLEGRVVDVIRVLDPARGLESMKAGLAHAPDLVVDGLFGIGLDRALDPAWTEVIHTLNAAKRPVLSVDVPSGLNADTGLPQPVAVKARWTFAVGALKQGLLAASAAASVGHLELLAEIGLVECAEAGELEAVLPSDYLGFPPPRSESEHKGDFGHLAILAGSLGYHGAAVLAARGAARARPGLTSLFTSPETYAPVASNLVGTMVAPWRASFLDHARYSAILVGPGLAAVSGLEIAREALSDAWREADLPVIVDASALDWLQPQSVMSEAVRVITPHSGEAARMLGVDVSEVNGDRPGAVRALSRRYGDTWVVLKGSRTLIGRGKGVIRVNLSGNPGMAQGGSGDVLAGYLGGLLAQSALVQDPLQTLAYAVWMHGRTADYLESQSSHWVVEELAENLGATRF